MFEDYIEIVKLIVYRKVIYFIGIVEVLRRSILIEDSFKIIFKNVVEKVLFLENFRKVCFVVDIRDDGNYIGIECSWFYRCFLMFIVKWLKGILVKEIFKEIGIFFGKEICKGILKYIEVRVKNEFKEDLINIWF